MPDRCLSWNLFIRSFAEVAPSGRAFLDGHFLDRYAARAHNNGTVGRFVEDALALTHKQRTEDMQRFLDAFLSHGTSDRLLQVAVPTLVLAGRRDSTSRPEPCRSVAGGTSGAISRSLSKEAHLPFQDVPDQGNARVHAFWREVEEQAP